MKSNALKQITKQIKRLADLQTIELSVVFCVRDNVQERQLIKFCGSGEFLQNLKEGKPILGVEEIKRLSKTQEGYLPRIEHTVPLQMLTPSKLSCGPGVSKQIASRQKEMLEATSIITEDQDNSFSIDSPSTKSQQSSNKKVDNVDQRKPKRSKTKTKKASSSKDERGQRTKRKLIDETDSLEQNDNHSNENFNKNDEDYHDIYIAEVETQNISVDNEKEEEEQMHLSDTEREDQGMPIIKAPEKKKRRNSKNKDQEAPSIVPIDHIATEDINSDNTRNQINEDVTAEEAKKKRRNTKKKDQRTLSHDHIDQDASQDFQNDSNSQSDHDVTAEKDTENTWEINSYYAVAFEDRWYPGVVTAIQGDNKDWASIKYMHPSGENFKWPGKEDSALAHINAMLCRVNVNILANGRLWTVSNIGKIDNLYKSQSELQIVEIDYQ
ncbi:protein starmaker-like [Mytilus edulis]|uniref:protein starmaker-like n=1 Tax=Mytilus edulis TaxID=6550 RepID=UPI0039F019D8